MEQYTNYFFLISQSSLADKAPVIVTVSPTGVEQSQRRAGWEAAQADRNRPHAHCAAPYYKDPSLLTSISFLGNISLSKQRHRNHASKECYVCIFLPPSGLLDKIRHKWYEAFRAFGSTSSGQGQSTPRILSHRGCNFGRGGQTDTYVEAILT